LSKFGQKWVLGEEVLDARKNGPLRDRKKLRKWEFNRKDKKRNTKDEESGVGSWDAQSTAGISYVQLVIRVQRDIVVRKGEEIQKRLVRVSNSR